MKRALLHSSAGVLLAFTLAAGPVAASAAQEGKTADQQSNKKSDVKVTADIRKAVVADKSLSTAAHNVKIITQNGTVTLKGSVKSEAEREAVVQKAREVAGQDKVVDNMTIAPPKS
jgi:hyperosmotically inducible periplasmic protein